MLNKVDKLVEATMLALQGKLELKENKRIKSESRSLSAKQKKLIRQYVKDGKKKNWAELIKDLEEINDYETLNQDVRRFIDDIDLEEDRKTKKSESIDVNVDNNTTVSVEGNETIVDTADATVIVNKKEDTFVPETSDDVPMDNPVVDAETTPNTDMVEVPADDTVMPEDVLDEPVNTELPTEDEELPLGESKKVENVEIEIKDDGKEVEVKTDNGEEVEVKDETEDKEDTDEEPKESEDTDVLEVSDEDKPEDETMFEENKKVETSVRDGADAIYNDARYKGEGLTSLNAMLASKIADIAEELGDDYSEWLGDTEIKEIIDTIVNSNEWTSIEESLNSIIKDAVIDKVDWIRKDDPASKYYDGNGLDEGKQEKQNEKDIKKDLRRNRVQEMITRRRAKKQESENNIPYDNTTEKTCPMCKKKYTQYPALSRRDNKTYICPDCGVAEAMQDFISNRKKDEALTRLKNLKPNKVTEDKELKEDTEEYLDARYDARKSFYNKAKVVKKDNGDEELYSYGTHVAGVRGGKPYSKGKFSQTTSRHQKEFFKQRDFDIKDVPVEETKKTESKEEVKKDTNDLGINEGVPKKEEPVPNTETKVNESYNKESFENVLGTFYKNKYRNVENVIVDKISRTRKGLKIESRLVRNNKEKSVCLELKQIRTGITFDKYEVINPNNLINESKSSTIMTTIKDKNNGIGCRYIISK